MKTVLLIIAFFIYSQVIFAENDSCITNIKLGISFPPFSSQTERDFSSTHLTNLNVSLIRIGEDWSLREPNRGVYNWSPLDERMRWIGENKYSALLTIQSRGPDWASDPILRNDLSSVFSDSAAFHHYIDSLLFRYGDYIEKIQFGNEWHSEYWYIGSAKDFIRAHNTLWSSVKSIAPHIKVVLGGFASGTLTVLSGYYGYLDSIRMPDSDYFYSKEELNTHFSSPKFQKTIGKQDSILKMCNYDIIDIHLYDDVENWSLYYNIIDSLCNYEKPIIVSEMGGPNLINELPYSDDFQAQRLFEYIKCVDTLGVSEVYYFKLIDGGNSSSYHRESGLIDEETLTEKSAYYLFQTMNRPCGSVHVCDNLPKSKFIIYPNPASDYIEINLKRCPTSEIEIYNTFGACVLDLSDVQHLGDVGHLKRIDISHLPVGLYFIQIGNYSEKFIVMR